MEAPKTQLIVIDGGINIGKATQSDMLVNRLMNEGVLVGKMDFPRYHQNTIGHLIGDCIEGDTCQWDELDPRVVATLFAADRYESKAQIEEWLEEGRVIVFDRYVTSNMLHQGAKIEDIDRREEFLRWVEHLEYEIFGMPRPQLTVYLEVPPDDSTKLLQYLEDVGAAATGEEEKHKVHQAKVSECARYLSNLYGHWKTVPCIDEHGLRPRDSIHEDVYAIVSDYIR